MEEQTKKTRRARKQKSGVDKVVKTVTEVVGAAALIYKAMEPVVRPILAKRRQKKQQ